MLGKAAFVVVLECHYVVSSRIRLSPMGFRLDVRCGFHAEVELFAWLGPVMGLGRIG